MRIVYFLKKGLQCYPPCLTQVLMLHDLGAELVVYHGKNSDYIDELLENRKIEHYEFLSDSNSKNKFQRAVNFLKFVIEFRKKFVFNNEDVLWFGNVETILAANFHELKKYRFILNILELYDEGTIYDIKLRKILNKSIINICCEKHRAAIMRCRYNLQSLPFVMNNRPYEFYDDKPVDEKYKKVLDKHKGQFIIVYQGIISKDRPIDKIADALRLINDNKITLLILGKCNDDYRAFLQDRYHLTEFLGYVPAPEHLAITALCHIGIANYKAVNLNNEFCAPNKIYEYAKYGLPMLCSCNIGLLETVGVYKAGECIDLENTQEIVNAIQKIKDNYREYSARALRLYKESDNELILREIYGKVIKIYTK